MSSPREVFGLDIQIGPMVYIHVRPLDRLPPCHHADTFDGQHWLDVHKGDCVEVDGQPIKVLDVALHDSRPSVPGFPEIVSGRDWIEWGTVLDPRR
jgi:hypothetical protein